MFDEGLARDLVSQLFVKYDFNRSETLEGEELGGFFNEAFSRMRLPINVTRDEVQNALKSCKGRATKQELFNAMNLIYMVRKSHGFQPIQGGMGGHGVQQQGHQGGFGGNQQQNFGQMHPGMGPVLQQGLPHGQPQQIPQGFQNQGVPPQLYRGPPQMPPQIPHQLPQQVPHQGPPQMPPQAHYQGNPQQSPPPGAQYNRPPAMQMPPPQQQQQLQHQQYQQHQQQYQQLQQNMRPIVKTNSSQQSHSYTQQRQQPQPQPQYPQQQAKVQYVSAPSPDKPVAVYEFDMDPPAPGFQKEEVKPSQMQPEVKYYFNVKQPGNEPVRMGKRPDQSSSDK